MNILFIILLIAGGISIIHIIMSFRDSDESFNSMQLQKKPSGIRKSHGWIYTEVKVRQFPIVGTYYDIGKNRSYEGAFIGYAKCDYNPYDYYSVGIFNSSGTQIGYVPRKNKWLHTSLNHYHNGSVFAWGRLNFNENSNSWSGWVSIPAGFNFDQIEAIKSILQINQKNDSLYTKKDKSFDDYRAIFNNHKLVIMLAKEHNTSLVFYYPLKKSVILSYSKLLEQKEDWLELIELKEYASETISAMSERNKEKVNIRIMKALSLNQKSLIQVPRNVEPLLSQEINSIDHRPNLDNVLFQWETPRAFWSKEKLPGYRYSEKKKAWWKQK